MCCVQAVTAASVLDSQYQCLFLVVPYFPLLLKARAQPKSSSPQRCTLSQPFFGFLALGHTGSSQGRATPVWHALLSFPSAPWYRYVNRAGERISTGPSVIKSIFPLTRKAVCPGNEVLSVSLCQSTLSLRTRVLVTAAVVLSPVAAQGFWVAALASPPCLRQPR